MTTEPEMDMFNVQRLQETSHPLSQASASASVNVLPSGLESSSTSAGGGSAAGVYGGAAHSTGGSTVGSTPSSPLRPHKEEEQHDDSSEEGAATPGGSRAQYVSANCVVFTHYQGDAAAVVDEHFSRALDKNTHAKDTSPMSTRNFPPSFWNSAQYGTTGAGASGGGDLYQGAAGGDHYHPGDWYHQYTAASHRAVHDYHHHHHNMAAQYGSLLLPGSRLHMPGAQCKAMDWQHPSLENPYTSYSTMTGLEAQVQDSSKDLYWF